MTTPLVSVLIPAYQAETTIARALRSVIDQSVGAWEAIIAPDDSVDYAPVIAAQGITDPRIRCLARGPIGSGPSAARNRALDAATGRYITPLDADDLFLPERLDRLVALAEAKGAAVDNVRVVDDATGAVISHVQKPVDRLEPLAPAAILASPVPLMPLVPRETAPRWCEPVRLAEDVVFALEVWQRVGELPMLALPLREYRVREGSICHSPESADLAEASYKAILELIAEGKLFGETPQLAEIARRGFEGKRAFNARFAAETAGTMVTFQSFAAERW